MNKKIAILSSNVVRVVYKFFCILFLYSNQLYSQQSAFWGDLNKGQYDVGFNVVYKFDHSRIFHGDEPVTGKKFPGEQTRPVRIFVYPANQKRKGQKNAL